MIANRSRLADILGVALTTIDAYLREGMPFVERANKATRTQWQFDVPAVVEWLLQRATRGIDAPSADPSLADANRRELSARASLREMDLAYQRKHLITPEDVSVETADALADMIEMYRTLPAAISARLAATKDAAMAERILTAAFQSVLGGGAPDDYIDEEPRWRGVCVAFRPVKERDELFALDPVARQGAVGHLPRCLCAPGECRGSWFVPEGIPDEQLSSMRTTAAARLADYLAQRAAAEPIQKGES